MERLLPVLERVRKEVLVPISIDTVSPEVAKVCLEAGADIRIRVTDDGCGIAPENRKRIFEPFFSARQGGTGLGLFLSLNFVRRWGGDILVESVVGEGSTFEVVLPALAGEPELAS